MRSPEICDILRSLIHWSRKNNSVYYKKINKISNTTFKKKNCKAQYKCLKSSSSSSSANTYPIGGVSFFFIIMEQCEHITYVTTFPLTSVNENFVYVEP